MARQQGGWRSLALWGSCWLLAGCVQLPRAPLAELPPLPVAPPAVELVAAPPLKPAPTETSFTLPEAVNRAVESNPRLLVYRAAVARAGGLSEAAFAPFLPQLDVLNRAGTTNPNVGPGAPGIVGGIVPDKIGVPYTFAQVELQIQWTLCDFGRTAGRFGQAVSREKIAALRLDRARQTVGYEAASSYLEGLQTKAVRVIVEDAIRQARAVLEDTRVRNKAGVLLRDAVLRAEVQVSESEEGLAVATEAELAAQARLNNVLGRDASLPLQLADRDEMPLLGLSLDDCLARAARERLEVAVVREAIAAATQGREAAAAEYLPKIYALSGLGNVQGDHVNTGWTAGAGIHLNQPLYQGGKRQGELRAADAEVQEALAQARVLLDAITLEVTLAYRHVTTGRQRIELARPAVTQAEENLRLVRTRYQNGDAIPLDVIDAQTAQTRARQRLVSATYEYQIGLARLEYAIGANPGCLLGAEAAPRELPPLLPAPRPVDEKKVQQPAIAPKPVNP